MKDRAEIITEFVGCALVVLTWVVCAVMYVLNR